MDLIVIDNMTPETDITRIKALLPNHLTIATLRDYEEGETQLLVDPISVPNIRSLKNALPSGSVVIAHSDFDFRKYDEKSGVFNTAREALALTPEDYFNLYSFNSPRPVSLKDAVPYDEQVYHEFLDNGILEEMTEIFINATGTSWYDVTLFESFKKSQFKETKEERKERALDFVYLDDFRPMQMIRLDDDNLFFFYEFSDDIVRDLYVGLEIKGTIITRKAST